MLKSFRQIAKTRALTQVYTPMARFGGGHHVQEYDWRDDPNVNKDIYVDPRDKGWDPKTYSFPYSGSDDWIFPVTGHKDYDPYNLSHNLRPENKRFDKDYTSMRVFNCE
jgi:hypothetical protein